MVERSAFRRHSEQWKRISRMSTNLSLESALDCLPELVETTGFPLDILPAPSKLLRVKFQVRAFTRFGYGIALVGSAQELGMWSVDRKLPLSTDKLSYPIWTSDEVLLTAASKLYLLEYKYVLLEPVISTQKGGIQWEKNIPNRKLEVRFDFTNQLCCTIQDQFEVSSSHTITARCLPLFSNLTESGSSYDDIQVICEYFETRQPSLQDFLCAAFMFRNLSVSGLGSESKQSLEVMLRLVAALETWSSDEVEPVIRDILDSMALCNVSFWNLMHRILDRNVVESEKVPLGCHSPELHEFLLDLLNSSQVEVDSAACTKRIVVINSIRRCLRRLVTRSSTPCLILLYDVCLEQLTWKYAHDLAHENCLASQLHCLSLVLEALELSSVCSESFRTYSHGLESLWNCSELPCESSLETGKSLLLDLLRTVLAWKTDYIINYAVQSDPLQLSELLTSIIGKSLQLLFPLLSSILSLLDEHMHRPLYLPVVTGSAEGSIFQVSDVNQIPADAPSVIAVLPSLPLTPTLPVNIKAVIVQGCIDLTSALVTFCSIHSIPLLSTTQPLPTSTIRQVHIFEDSIDFI